MCDTVFEELVTLKDSGRVNMLDVQAAFPLALEMGLDTLANFIFEHTNEYSAFIVSEHRE